MEECRHCNASFEEEQELLQHVADEHPDELGEIERRRLQRTDDGSWTPHPGVAAGVAVSLVIAGVFVYFLLFADVTEVVEPTERGAVHDYGTITLEVDGETIDLSQDEYLEADVYWYLDPGSVDQAREGYVWERHARDVTLEYALFTIGVDVGDDTSNATYVDVTSEDREAEERSYDRRDGDAVEVTVDDREVDPRSYRLQGVGNPEDVEDGDRIHVVLEAAE